MPLPNILRKEPKVEVDETEEFDLEDEDHERSAVQEKKNNLLSRLTGQKPKSRFKVTLSSTAFRPLYGEAAEYEKPTQKPLSANLPDSRKRVRARIKAQPKRQMSVQDFAERLTNISVVEVIAPTTSDDPSGEKKNEEPKEEVMTAKVEKAAAPEVISDGKVECEECHKLVKKSWYKQHLKTHLTKRVKSRFACQVCGQKFTRRGDVHRHRIVTHLNERPFKCDKCGKDFANKTLLRIHSATHDNKKGFSCLICNHRFGRKEYYINHVRFVHPGGGDLDEIWTDPRIPEAKKDEDNNDADDRVMEVAETNEEPNELVIEASAAFESSSGQILVLSQEQFEKLQKGGFVRGGGDSEQVVENAEISVVDSIPNSEDQETDAKKSSEQVGDSSSQDAVQTLIDAVEVLIQTHEKASGSKS